MGRSTTLLKSMSVSPRLHEKTKIIATMTKQGMGEVADNLFLPIAEKRADQLILEAAKNGNRK